MVRWYARRPSRQQIAAPLLAGRLSWSACFVSFFPAIGVPQPHRTLLAYVSSFAVSTSRFPSSHRSLYPIRRFAYIGATRPHTILTSIQPFCRPYFRHSSWSFSFSSSPVYYGILYIFRKPHASHFLHAQVIWTPSSRSPQPYLSTRTQTR